MSMRSRLLNELESTVDPPTVDVVGGGNEDRAPVEQTAADGGISGFIRPSVWELLTKTSEEVAMRTQMTLLMDQLEGSPPFRRGQVAASLEELRKVLERVPHTSSGEEEVSVPIGTVTILAHTLLRHQP